MGDGNVVQNFAACEDGVTGDTFPNVKLELFQIALFILAGFLIEAITLADESNTAKNVGFNLAWTAIRTFFDLTLGAAFWLWLTTITRLAGVKPMFPLAHISWILPAIIIGFITRDFFYYWFHRLQHASRWLWAEHELHHSDEHMNVTTALRHHWLETPIESLLVTLPMTLLFGSPRLTVLSYLVSRSAGFFVHMNSRINLGRWFGSPALHRVHHSKLPEHIDKNFAPFIPLWDVIFGTYFAPPQKVPPTGLISGETVYSLPRAVVMPFISWAKISRSLVGYPDHLIAGVAIVGEHPVETSRR